ncbi:N-acetylmuramoyl-L-alanine amidase [Aquimarina sp. I32.4]|uniref:N-acetylmuramoyl-L-alanine amidase family protein n=1 Tax=Aquimarina sp. I32.4 TaxID=2053903 RepID=UPI001E4FA37C|nr:N-acetylmuramoyl-L-alanine amidase [Aquimarina sp. I32.4]
MTIVIDPGHGGSDTGAIGINGIKEKDVVLQIAKEMIHWNKVLFANKNKIYLTRYTDTLISLRDRSRLTRKLQADLFISLHCNQSKNPNARGTEVFVSSTNGTYLQQSIILAYQIAEAMHNNLGFRSRGVKFGNFLVLRETASTCPAVLVELGFLSNWDEGIYLSEEKSQCAIAIVILQSVFEFLRL